MDGHHARARGRHDEYKYVVIDDAAGTHAVAGGEQPHVGVTALAARRRGFGGGGGLLNPNPEAMPIMLHALDGSVKEVGSTQLLRECVRELRTEQAISTAARI